MAHAMLATAMKMPELNINQAEAEALAEATANVMQYYNFNPDPKTGAWISLGFAIMLIYSNRIGAIKTRIAANKANAPQQKTPKKETPANVTPFPQGPVDPSMFTPQGGLQLG